VTIRLRRWTDADLPVLIAANAPQMMMHLAGPETAARVRRRHEQYVRGWDTDGPRMYTVREGDDAVGAIGFWDSEWNGSHCLETGWTVLPSHQRRGIATAAVRLLIPLARAHGVGDVLVACPSVENEASNAVCRRAQFTPRGTLDDTYRGEAMTLNVWTYDLG